MRNEVGSIRKIRTPFAIWSETVGKRGTNRLVAWRITAESEDVRHPYTVVLVKDRIDLFPRRSNAGQVGNDGEIELLMDAPHESMSLVAGRATRPVGNADVVRLERKELFSDRSKESFPPLVVLRGKELKTEQGAPASK